MTALLKKPFMCGACHKRFTTKQSGHDHAIAAHPKARDLYIFECVEIIRQAADDDEPSMADIFIEGQMNRAMGIRNDDWIEDMLP